MGCVRQTRCHAAVVDCTVEKQRKRRRDLRRVLFLLSESEEAAIEDGGEE